jgi:hypothetical protein
MSGRSGPICRHHHLTSRGRATVVRRKAALFVLFSFFALFCAQPMALGASYETKVFSEHGNWQVTKTKGEYGDYCQIQSKFDGTRQIAFDLWGNPPATEVWILDRSALSTPKGTKGWASANTDTFEALHLGPFEGEFKMEDDHLAQVTVRGNGMPGNALFGALLRSGWVEISVASVTMRFDLKGAGEMADAYDRCIGSR